MTATNPFTQIKAAIRGYVEAHWDSLPTNNPAKVKVGNRWSRDDRKAARAPADLPAVEIRPVEGGDSKPLHTSSSGVFVREYEFGIATDGQTTDDPALDQCEWELIRVATKAALEKLDLPELVLKVDISSSRQTDRDLEASRQHRTWTGAVVISVQFQVKRTDIVPA